MRSIVVVSKLDDWPLELPDVETVLASDYLTDPVWAKERGLRVYNLCRSYAYQSTGYYVSLLAVARRHRPFPGLLTVLDMKSRAVVRSVADDLDAIIQKSLAGIQSKRFELSIYFGRNMAKRHGRLAKRLFDQFPGPLLRAQFVHDEDWNLTRIAPVALRHVSEAHWPFVADAAREYFARPRFRSRATRRLRYDMAILHDPNEALAPSDSKALARFRSAAEEVGFAVEMVQREDYGRLAEFDALFVRETTSVNHHTFRFAQRAESEGLVVIDDPRSILCCSNKVFMTEVFEQRSVPTPRTYITDHIDVDEIEARVGLPCVLKYPDSAFSQGVLKATDADELAAHGHRILAESDLLLAQEFMVSDFDWRIGIFNGQPLYACRYHMAAGHWQIVKRDGAGKIRYGRVETVPLEEVSPGVVKMALRAAAPIGDGLYGVDLKQFGKRVVVIEVNDNPSLDAGCEDAILGDELYLTIMRGFMSRVEERKSAGAK